MVFYCRSIADIECEYNGDGLTIDTLYKKCLYTLNALFVGFSIGGHHKLV